MKVLEIIGEPILHGGEERYLINLLKNIDYTDLNIDVLTPYYAENDSFINLIKKNNGHVYELNLDFKPGKSRRLIFKPIQSFLQKSAYDVVHIHSGSISVLAYASLAAKTAGIKKVIVHSHCSAPPSIKRSLVRFLFGFVLKNCATDYLACSYDAGESKFPRKIVNNELLIAKNGIEINDYSFDIDKRIDKRKQLNIPQDSFVIGHVGRFSLMKNHTFLVDLFSAIHQQKPDSYLLLVGDGELFDIVKEKVDALGLTNSVIFTGNVDDVPYYYCAMDVFVLPSLYEGLPFVALEAQAAGLPCIFSNEVPEATVIGNHVIRLCLSDSQVWVNTVLSMEKIAPLDNYGKIKSSGYSVIDTAAVIRNIYLS